MQRFTAGKQWLIIIGLIVGVRVARAVLPPPLALAVIVFYFLFVLWVHVARAVGNFQLSLDRFGLPCLEPGGNLGRPGCVGGGVIPRSAAFRSGDFARLADPLIVGLGLVGLSFPLAYVFTNQSHIGRWVFRWSRRGRESWLPRLLSCCHRIFEKTVGRIGGIGLAGGSRSDLAGECARASEPAELKPTLSWPAMGPAMVFTPTKASRAVSGIGSGHARNFSQ